MCTINNSREGPFGSASDGCPVPVENGICGETKTLDIINEFKRLYEEKMKEIDNTSCGDCLQEKVKLQQDWIGDLTEQNEMLVRAVEELEQEATERVKMLEEKLQRSAECICEVEKRSKEKDSTIHNLEGKVGELKSLSTELNVKREECANLQKNMVDMRQALTEEVATKHDAVLKLKRECQELEERCIQADKQTAFRDDIIKELRKEIKQLKQQLIHCLEDGKRILESKNCSIQKDKEAAEKIKLALEEQLNETKYQIRNLENDFNNFLQEKQRLKEKCKATAQQGLCISEECHKLHLENNTLKEKMEKLRIELEKCMSEKARLMDQMNQLSRDVEDCMCQKPCTFPPTDSRKLSEDLYALNVENRCLFQTIDNQRNKLEITSCITQEEVEKLNRTIDELRRTVEESKRLQEEEDKQKCSENCALNEKIKELEVRLADTNEKIKGKKSEISTLNNKIKDLECCLCDANEKIKDGCSEISAQNNRINELERCLCDAKEEISTVNNRIKDLECCLCDAQEKTKRKNEQIDAITNKIKESENRSSPCGQENLEDKREIDTLKGRIKELETCLCEMKGKVKLCKYCKHSLRVGFCDSTEVQTDADEESSGEQLEKLLKRDELIRFQADTLKMLQQELQSLQEREKEWLSDKEISGKSCDDIRCLENQVSLLKDKLIESESRVGELDEAVRNKEDIIKTQTEALHYIEKQLDLLRGKDSEMRIEHEHQCLCIQQLKCRISELETTSEDVERRASNLQMAVDLYTNTINVLEATEEKYKLEIDHQRTTITNLQEALVAAKNELDTTKQKIDDSVIDQQNFLTKCLQMMSENELENKNLKEQISVISDRYEKLQELNFSVEVEHCNSLQDVEGLDHQLYKYQSLLKNSEDELKECKCHLKTLLKQKKSFEEVIQYFKQEMAMMSAQLENLQELLTLSHDSALEESNKLISAFKNIQDLNQRLTIQLTAAEQKVLLENQMNQLNEVKISELEKIVSEKEIDLDKHSETIQSIKHSLSYSLEQNEELQTTIASLTETIHEFQQAVHKYENDNLKSKEMTVICQNQIESCKEKLTELKDLIEKKTSELCKIETAFNNQHRSLKCCQRELKEIKDRQKNKQYYLKCVIEELKDKLTKTEEEREKYLREFKKLQERMCAAQRREDAKGSEISRYRKIIGDLKNTLTDFNRNLTKKEIPFKSKCNTEECKKYIDQFNKSTGSICISQREEEEIYINCPCELDFYQTIVDTLKKAVTELKTRLFDSQRKNKDLEKELREKEFQVQEISRTQLEKDKEYNELKEKLMARLKAAQDEEFRYSERSRQFEKELGSLRRELELKTLQMNEIERNSQQVNGSRCVQLACAQEEINVLKEQLNRLLKQHCALNMENEKLHSQSTKMQTAVTTVEEKSLLLKSQVEQYLLELQMVQKEKDALHLKNKDLLRELRSVQTSYDFVCGQKRYNEDTIKSLETELEEVKKNRDDICFESKTVVDYFRLWLKEQKNINDYTIAKEKDYCQTIEMLKRQNQDAPCEYAQPPFSRNMSNLRATQQDVCQSPWSLGSQGTSSAHDESPCRSPCVNESCDWYASNFRNESEDDGEDDQDWVTKVENLAAQVRKTNKMWKHKMEKADLTVSKDSKK